MSAFPASRLLARFFIRHSWPFRTLETKAAPPMFPPRPGFLLSASSLGNETLAALSVCTRKKNGGGNFWHPKSFTALGQAAVRGSAFRREGHAEWFKPPKGGTANRRREAGKLLKRLRSHGGSAI